MSDNYVVVNGDGVILTDNNDVFLSNYCCAGSEYHPQSLMHNVDDRVMTDMGSSNYYNIVTKLMSLFYHKYEHTHTAIIHNYDTAGSNTQLEQSTDGLVMQVTYIFDGVVQPQGQQAEIAYTQSTVDAETTGYYLCNKSEDNCGYRLVPYTYPIVGMLRVSVILTITVTK